jgi:hypothetical protein
MSRAISTSSGGVRCFIDNLSLCQNAPVKAGVQAFQWLHVHLETGNAVHLSVGSKEIDRSKACHRKIDIRLGRKAALDQRTKENNALRVIALTQNPDDLIEVAPGCLDQLLALATTQGLLSFPVSVKGVRYLFPCLPCARRPRGHTL